MSRDNLSQLPNNTGLLFVGSQFDSGDVLRDFLRHVSSLFPGASSLSETNGKAEQSKLNSNQNFKEEINGRNKGKEAYSAIQRWIEEKPYHQVWNAVGVMAGLKEVEGEALGVDKQEKEFTGTMSS